MGKVAVNLEEDETLADAVRKYKVLYDKSMPEYKEKLTKSNAWRKVDKSLGQLFVTAAAAAFLHGFTLI